MGIGMGGLKTAFECGQEAQALEGRMQEVSRENVDYAENLCCS